MDVRDVCVNTKDILITENIILIVISFNDYNKTNIQNYNFLLVHYDT